MIESPMDVLKNHPVRRTGKQKRSFRDAVQSYAENCGYVVTTESGKSGSRNLVIGDPETARYLITAHYDTPVALWVSRALAPCSLVSFLMSQTMTMVGLLLPAAVAAGVTAYLTPGTRLWYPAAVAAVCLTFMWMLWGPANRRNANGNTSGVVAVLETMSSMPRIMRDRVCFVLFDKSEPMGAGAASYRRKHRQTSDKQLVLNLDCVGDGDILMMFPAKRVRKDAALMERLCAMERACGERSIQVWQKGSGLFLSDQKSFPRGIGICALRKKRFIRRVGRIHTIRDNVLEYTNINILRACLITFISSGAVE